jgi:murein peptide amidase A
MASASRRCLPFLLAAAALGIPAANLQSTPAALATSSTHLRLLLGRSLHGRPIWAVEVGDSSSALKAVVVGCIDGNETAGIQITRTLQTARIPPRVDLWLINDMNPDGVAANTLQNADRVDLNRNFPWQWQPLGQPGYWQYSGRRPLSEPESRAVHTFLLKIRPRLVVWYHQPLATVDQSGGNATLEQHYAKLVGLPIVRLPRYPGSATSWVNHHFPGSTSFVVELKPGQLSHKNATRHANAILTLLQDLVQHSQ